MSVERELKFRLTLLLHHSKYLAPDQTTQNFLGSGSTALDLIVVTTISGF